LLDVRVDSGEIEVIVADVIAASLFFADVFHPRLRIANVSIQIRHADAAVGSLPIRAAVGRAVQLTGSRVRRKDIIANLRSWVAIGLLARDAPGRNVRFAFIEKPLRSCLLERSMKCRRWLVNGSF